MGQKSFAISGREIGHGLPTYFIAEIGINHNGDIEIAKRMMAAAAKSGCDAVKFQKRTPKVCVPPEQQGLLRDTPWGTITYLEYKEKLEFGLAEYEQIAALAAQLGVDWLASPWDVPSVEFLNQLNVCCHKVASACITDLELLQALNESGRPVIMSTGMSTMDEIRNAVSRLSDIPLALTHATSTYPCPPEQLNLRMIETLRREFNVPIGYSGHETGLGTTVAAAALGACIIERHFTLDRAMWGTDQAASVEPVGFQRLVGNIRAVGVALGDGIKHVYEAERAVATKLRRF